MKNVNQNRDFFVPFSLFLLAFGVRLFFLIGSLDNNSLFSFFYFGNAPYHHNFVVSILSGKMFNDGLPFQPPLISLILYIFYSIGGSGFPPFFVKIFLALLNAGSVSLLYLFGSKAFGKTAALLACTCACFSFSQMILCSSLNNECLYQICIFSLLFLTVSEAGKWNILSLLLAGFLAGFSVLANADFLFFLPLLAIGIYLGHSGRRLKKATSALLVLIAAILVILPWSFRNYTMIGLYNEIEENDEVERLSRISPVVNTGPADFLCANNVLSKGEFSREIISGKYAGSRIQINNYYDRYLFNHGYREGLRFMRNHPERAIRLMWKKLVLLSRSFSLGFGRNNFPLGLRGTRRPADIFTPDSNWFIYPQLFLFLAGCYLYLREGRAKTAHLVYFLFLHALFITVIFFGFVKRGAVLLPIAYLFMFYCVGYAFGKIKFPSAVKTPKAKKILYLTLVLSLFLYEGLRSGTYVELELRGIMTKDGEKLIQEERIRITPLEFRKRREAPKSSPKIKLTFSSNTEEMTWQTSALSFTLTTSSTRPTIITPRSPNG